LSLNVSQLRVLKVSNAYFLGRHSAISTVHIISNIGIDIELSQPLRPSRV